MQEQKSDRDFKAVIFDMDGVIVDSEPRHERAFLEVVGEIGYGETHGVRWADWVGRSDHELWLDFVARHRPAQSLEQLLKMKRDRVLEIIRREEPIFAGLAELVENHIPGAWQFDHWGCAVRKNARTFVNAGNSNC